MTSQNKIRVWDLPTRLGHWSLVVSLVVAELTSESERWRNIHVKAGYAMLVILVFRIFWGFAGSRHARWTAFPLSANRIRSYAASLIRRPPIHYTGHNPLGSIAILVLMAAILVVAVSGIMVYESWGSSHMDRYHDWAADVLLAVVGIHLAGVVISSWLHHENLVSGMITGQKLGNNSEKIEPASGRFAAGVLVAIIALTLMIT